VAKQARSGQLRTKKKKGEKKGTKKATRMESKN
jgi:hypothetical protein